MTLAPSEMILYALVAGVAALLAWCAYLTVRLRRLTRGGKSGSIDQAIETMDTELAALRKFAVDAKIAIGTIDRRLQGAVRGVHARSFSAFEGLESGGQSFAAALVSEKGDGVVLSAFHSRDRVNVFAKPVENFASSVPLSEEESGALTKAREACSV
ncbi:MAG TPA: DUF4446 family protein [Candidatus Paceibacterota bacterium]